MKQEKTQRKTSLRSCMPASVLLAGAGDTVSKLAEPVLYRCQFVSDFAPDINFSELDLLSRPCLELKPVFHPVAVHSLSKHSWSLNSDETVLRSSVKSRDVEDEFIQSGARIFDVKPELLTVGNKLQDVRVKSQVVKSLKVGSGVVKLPSKVNQYKLTRTFEPFTPVELLLFLDDKKMIVQTEKPVLKLLKLASTALVFQVESSNPAQVALSDALQRSVVSVVEAGVALERNHLSRSVSVDAEVLDLSEMKFSGPTGREGLYAYQDQGVSALLSTRIGAVLACPVGTGKTVICAKAIGELVSQREVVKVVVAAPRAVLPQWLDELQTWAGLRVKTGMARGAKNVTEKLYRLSNTENTEVVVVIGGVDEIASWGAKSRSNIDLLVVDEAGVLLGNSKRSRGLWSLRSKATMAWALSGTPEEKKGTEDVAKLVAWARNKEERNVTPGAPELFDPVLFGMNYGGETPKVEVYKSVLREDSDSKLWFEELFASTGKAKTGFEKFREEQTVLKGLTDPVLVNETWDAKNWLKRRWLSEKVLERRKPGMNGPRGPVIVFSSTARLNWELQDMFEQLGLKTDILDGSLNASERLGLLARFESGKTDVLLLSQAGQRGVNLQSAETVVHLDSVESYTQFEQRNGRAARIGSRYKTVEALLCCFEGMRDAQRLDEVLESVEMSEAFWEPSET